MPRWVGVEGTPAVTFLGPGRAGRRTHPGRRGPPDGTMRQGGAVAVPWGGSIREGGIMLLRRAGRTGCPRGATAARARLEGRDGAFPKSRVRHFAARRRGVCWSMSPCPSTCVSRPTPVPRMAGSLAESSTRLRAFVVRRSSTRRIPSGSRTSSDGSGAVWRFQGDSPRGVATASRGPRCAGSRTRQPSTSPGLPSSRRSWLATASGFTAWRVRTRERSSGRTSTKWPPSLTGWEGRARLEGDAPGSHSLARPAMARGSPPPPLEGRD